ncbi:MAG TPA: hypothetical protein VJN32_04455 [Dehalococcoidia bacterium]|nr:hypothetical protein [Dehalococcoidia bacterium]
MDSFFADCGSASVAVQTAALAAVATALAALAFVSAYILRTVRRWQVWSGSNPTSPPNDD